MASFQSFGRLQIIEFAFTMLAINLDRTEPSRARIRLDMIDSKIRANSNRKNIAIKTNRYVFR
jgi:hypothetical protein